MVDAFCPESVDYLDLDPYGREIDDPLLELYQDLVHRLFEAPGSNLDDVDRGVGISSIMSQAFDANAGGGPSQSVARAIEHDFRKDSRVRDVAANVVQTSATPVVLTVTINVVADEGELGITLVSDGTTVRVVPPGGV